MIRTIRRIGLAAALVYLAVVFLGNYGSGYAATTTCFYNLPTTITNAPTFTSHVED